MGGLFRYARTRILLATLAVVLVGAGTAMAAGVTGAADRPPESANGWWNGPVTITWTATPPFENPTPASEVVTTEGTSTHTSTACDTTTDPSTPDCSGSGTFTTKIDTTAPTITGARSPAANVFGWNNGNVTVSFTCNDGGSGIDTCTGGGTLTTETDGTTVTGTATDNVGHATGSAGVLVKIDKTAPTIAAAGRTPGPNAYGWNNTNVTATFTCSDGGVVQSGIDLSDFGPVQIDPSADPDASGLDGSCPTAVITTEGANQRVAKTVKDKAGNTSASVLSVAGVNIDKTKPTVTINQPTGPYDRNAAAAAAYTCGDGLSGVASCVGSVANGAAVDTSQGGTNQTLTVNALDKAGNAQTGTKTYSIRPAAPELVAPANGVTTNNKRPEFRWNNSAGSQVTKYEVYVKGAKIGTVNTPAQTGQSAFTPTADLPINTSLDWYVKAYGANGTTKDSLHRTLTVDPSVPNAPTLTSGPVGPTNITTPTFTWVGTGLTFPWKVRRVSDDVVVQQGTTTAQQITVGPLPDGSYAFEVQQAGPNNVPGDAAVLAFSVDARPPGAPTIVSGPGATTDVRTPAFAWVGEPGGSFVWTVLGGGGAVRSGATDARSITVGPALDPGAWTFIVQQVDSAGNVSAPSAGYAFTITPPPAPAALPPAVAATALPATVTAKKSTKRANSVLTPKTLNAKLLLPKAGAKLRTLTPVLRWKKRPKGVKIYNLQVFLNNKKILSRFPTGQSFKVPKGVLKPGKQYIWRVWPYFGHYPKNPLGLSYFTTVAAKKPATKAVAKKK
jgi:hypothetical protein